MSQIFLYVIIIFLFLFLIRKLIKQKQMKEYTAKEVANLLNSSNILLLDVRSYEERAQNQIKDSLHIPINELTEKIHLLEQYRDKEIICYCYSGSRSYTAAAILQTHGFKSANMKGGILKWKF